MRDTLINLQITRKSNLKKVIDQEFNGKVEDFAKSLGKNKFFIYGLLWDIDKRASRNITDKTARLIEKNLRLPDGFLDNENQVEDASVFFIPFINISVSEANKQLSFSTEDSLGISKYELINNKLDPSTLLALRVFDDSMSNNFEIDDVVFIDLTKKDFISGKIYFIKLKNNFVLRKLTRSFDTDNIKISITNLNKSREYDEIEIKDISKIEILGSPVLRLNFIKGL